MSRSHAGGAEGVELIEDTVLEMGSEAYATALLVYNYAKASGKGSGLDGVVAEVLNVEKSPIKSSIIDSLKS